MRGAGVSLLPGGPVAAGGSWNLVAPIAGGFRPVFRQLLYIRVATGGAAHRAVVDAAASRIAGSFTLIERNALAQPGYATIAALSGNTVRVTLPVPERVVKVALSPAPAAGRSVYAHRLVGDAPGADAAAYAAHGASFVADFTDLRFALRVGTAPGTLDALAPAAIQELRLRSRPSSPRLSLAPASDLAAASIFWTAPGDIGADGGQPASAGVFDLRDAFAGALARQIDTLAAPLPASIDLALSAESDAPCTFALTALSVGGRLVREGFATAAEKEVLRFDGTGAERREVLIQVPRAVIATAALEMAESLRDDRPAVASVPSTNAPATPPSDDLEVSEGATLAVGRWCAQSFIPPRATLATGLGLALLPLAEGTEVSVEVREDYNGSPGGRLLADAVLAGASPGHRAWSSATFRDAVYLAAEPYWLVVGARNGGGAWLARPAEGTLLSGARTPDGRDSAADASLAGIEGLHRLLERPTVDPATGGTPPADPPVVVQLGETTITPAIADGRLQFDLASALNAHLAAAPGADPLVSVPLVVTSAVEGLVTLYPPRVEYTLPVV